MRTHTSLCQMREMAFVLRNGYSSSVEASIDGDGSDTPPAAARIEYADGHYRLTVEQGAGFDDYRATRWEPGFTGWSYMDTVEKSEHNTIASAISAAEAYGIRF